MRYRTRPGGVAATVRVDGGYFVVLNTLPRLQALAEVRYCLRSKRVRRLAEPHRARRNGLPPRARRRHRLARRQVLNAFSLGIKINNTKTVGAERRAGCG